MASLQPAQQHYRCSKMQGSGKEQQSIFFDARRSPPASISATRESQIFHATRNRIITALHINYVYNYTVQRILTKSDIGDKHGAIG